ncbi:ABC transporter permease [Thermogemmatispora carboxidivorans]|uniref:ABC transporter permease n=1 Tax=Thermogemmatispora carboxidivorans TaxID=1382306 RepID=UPI00069BC082|nr:ABC transporter permease [Thermogemmatispora carboxidivorans]
MSFLRPETGASQHATLPQPAPLERSAFLPPVHAYRRARGFSAVYQGTRSALRALRANALRSLLTSLGIIIGVGAVIMMISISEGNAAAINQRLSALNPTQLTIFPGSARGTGGVSSGLGSAQSLTLDDANAIAQLSHVTAVSPLINAQGQLVAGDQNWSTSVVGVAPPYQQIGGWQLQDGSFISQDDEDSGHTVAVLGQTVVDNLFGPGADPVGQSVRINGVPFTVIGVLAPKGTTGGRNADDVVYVPYTTARQRLSGGRSLGQIVLTADSTSNVGLVQNEVEQLLEQRHNIANPQLDDFQISNQLQVLQSVQGTNQALTILLVSVASVSLVVGGIGIMNIMLVSVTERTREIGIRIAIGARPRDVMTQFLIEALVLSILGGLIGIVLGPVGAWVLTHFTTTPFVLDPLSVLLAFGVSALVGVVFGFYPAQRAARLDPIVALRTE